MLARPAAAELPAAAPHKGKASTAKRGWAAGRQAACEGAPSVMMAVRRGVPNLATSSSASCSTTCSAGRRARAQRGWEGCSTTRCCLGPAPGAIAPPGWRLSARLQRLRLCCAHLQDALPLRQQVAQVCNPAGRATAKHVAREVLGDCTLQPSTCCRESCVQLAMEVLSQTILEQSERWQQLQRPSVCSGLCSMYINVQQRWRRCKQTCSSCGGSGGGDGGAPHLVRSCSCSSLSFPSSSEVSRRSVMPSTPSACSRLSPKGSPCRGERGERDASGGHAWSLLDPSRIPHTTASQTVRAAMQTALARPALSWRSLQV